MQRNDSLMVEHQWLDIQIGGEGTFFKIIEG